MNATGFGYAGFRSHQLTWYSKSSTAADLIVNTLWTAHTTSGSQSVLGPFSTLSCSAVAGFIPAMSSGHQLRSSPYRSCTYHVDCLVRLNSCPAHRHRRAFPDVTVKNTSSCFAALPSFRVTIHPTGGHLLRTGGHPLQGGARPALPPRTVRQAARPQKAAIRGVKHRVAHYPKLSTLISTHLPSPSRSALRFDPCLRVTRRERLSVVQSGLRLTRSVPTDRRSPITQDRASASSSDRVAVTKCASVAAFCNTDASTCDLGMQCDDTRRAKYAMHVHCTRYLAGRQGRRETERQRGREAGSQRGRIASQGHVCNRA